MNIADITYLCIVLVKYLRSEKLFRLKWLLQVATLETCKIIAGAHRQRQVCFWIQTPNILYQVRQQFAKDQIQVINHPTWSCKEAEEGGAGV